MNSSSILDIFLLSFILFDRFCRTASSQPGQTVDTIDQSYDENYENVHTDEHGNRQEWNGPIIEEVNDEGETINPENSNRRNTTNNIPVRSDFRTSEEKNNFFDECVEAIISEDDRPYDKDLMKSLLYSFRILCEISDDQLRNIGIGEHPNWFNGRVLVKSYITREQADRLQIMFDLQTRYFNTKAYIRFWVNQMIVTNLGMFEREFSDNNEYILWEDYLKITERNTDVLDQLVRSKERDIPFNIRDKLLEKSIITDKAGKCISPLERNFVGILGSLLKK
ncbi:hypothetical protein P3W45_000658 [Vairimorpha bombi]|jgi:hypothetical protein